MSQYYSEQHLQVTGRGCALKQGCPAILVCNYFWNYVLATLCSGVLNCRLGCCEITAIRRCWQWH